LCPDGFSGLPFFDKQNFQLENRYEAGAANVFAGGAGVDCDCAVVCVMCVGRGLSSRHRAGLRQDAAAGRGEPRPYKSRIAVLAGDGYGMPAGEVRGARLVAVDFAEDFAQAFASFMDLGFRIAHAAVEDFGDFVVFVTVQVVK